MEQNQKQNGAEKLESIANELQRESERLRQLAEELKKREEAHAEMIHNYPYFKAFVYSEMKKLFNCDKEASLPDDLEAWAKQQGALPLEAFIDELEHPKEVA